MSAQIDLRDVVDVIAVAIARSSNARDTLSVLSLAVSIAAIKCGSKLKDFGPAMAESYAEAEKVIASGRMDDITFDVIQ